MKVVFILVRGKLEYRDLSVQVGYYVIFGVEFGVLYYEQIDFIRSYEKNIFQEKKVQFVKNYIFFSFLSQEIVIVLF